MISVGELVMINVFQSMSINVHFSVEESPGLLFPYTHGYSTVA